MGGEVELSLPRPQPQSRSLHAVPLASAQVQLRAGRLAPRAHEQLAPQAQGRLAPTAQAQGRLAPTALAQGRLAPMAQAARGWKTAASLAHRMPPRMKLRDFAAPNHGWAKTSGCESWELKWLRGCRLDGGSDDDDGGGGVSSLW